MFLSYLAAAALASSSSSTELAMEYKRCVEQFAMSQIRSGETAEVLVAVGEADCANRLREIEAAIRIEVMQEVSEMPTARTLPWADVQALIDDTIADRMNDMRAQIHAAALRNVVFFKARVREYEGTDGQ